MDAERKKPAAVSHTICDRKRQTRTHGLTSPVWLNACSLSFEGFRNSLPHPSCSQARSFSPLSSAPTTDCDLDLFPGVLVCARSRVGERVDETSSSCTYSSSSSSSSESLCPAFNKADPSLGRGRSLAMLQEGPTCGLNRGWKSSHTNDGGLDSCRGVAAAAHPPKVVGSERTIMWFRPSSLWGRAAIY